MARSLRHFYKLIKEVYILDVLKYYLIVKLRSKSKKNYTIRLRNGLVVDIVPKAGDYCAFHEVFIKEDYKLTDNFLPKNILDIGANVGYYSLYASRKYPEAKIFSFEPFPSTHSRLTHNITTNKIENISPFPFAISDKNGKVNFYSIDWIGANTLNSDKFDVANCLITEVDCISFSNIFEMTKVESFDLAKIDCEGSEYPILINNPDESILKIKNYIIEVHPDKTYSAMDLKVRFEKLGYKTQSIGDILIAQYNTLYS